MSKHKQKVVIIDVDNTLWQFDDALYTLLTKDGIFIPHYSEWKEWDFYKKTIDKKVFFSYVDKVHENQHNYAPYKKSRLLSEMLFRHHFVSIISIRKNLYKSALIKFLKKWGIMFDDVVCLAQGADKTLYYGPTSCKLLIDDNPLALTKAKEKGVRCMGLKFPYNQHLANKIELFDSMNDLYTYFYFKELFLKKERNAIK